MGGREHVTLSKQAHTPSQVLRQCSCGCTTTKSMLVLNPALFATILELNPVPSLVTSAALCWSWISLLQWSSTLMIWTHQSIACSWVLFPCQGLSWDLGVGKKPLATKDSGWENLLLEIPSWHSLLISFCSLRNLESCPEKLVLDSAGFRSWLSVK